MLLSPSANRVYRQATGKLAAAELTVTADFASRIEVTTLAGCDALSFDADQIDELVLAAQSAQLVTFEMCGDLLRPLELPDLRVMDDDLVTIPKYQGKTNEGFTRLLLHLTLSQVARPGPLTVLDPLAGRGTTLLAAWQTGNHGFGVEADDKAFDALASYLKTYLRTKRIKHSAQVSPVRREGRSIGRRLDAEARLNEATRLTMTVFTGDTRDSAALYGRKRFDAIVTDAPYGVVHGAQRRDSRNQRQRDRKPADLLAEAIGVWASQLKPGGALGMSWNTFTLPRATVIDLLHEAGLHPLDTGAWRDFAHRVDSAINRDLVVART